MQHLRLRIGRTTFGMLQVPAAAALHFSFTVNVCWCWSRDWTCQQQCWTVLRYSYQLQSHWLLAGSWSWLSNTVQDRPRSDFSSSITGIHWTCVQCLWGSDGGQAQQDDQRAGMALACFPAIELEIRLNRFNWTEQNCDEPVDCTESDCESVAGDDEIEWQWLWQWWVMLCTVKVLLQHVKIENENWNEKIVQNWN